MNNIKILVVTHKKYKFPDDKLYVPILVNSNRLDDIGYLKDNDGKDNIADKNPNYCELTAMYWAWKNFECDIIGINHYRRYLSTESKSVISKNKTIDDKFNIILKKKDIINILKEHDVIITTTKLYTKNVYSKYDQQHYIQDLQNCISIIKDKYSEMSDSVDKVMKSKEYSICNMCVMKKSLYDEYCKWLFDVLFTYENSGKVDMTNYSKLQQRMFGFLSERLFNIWLDYKKLRCYKANMVSLEHDDIKTIWYKAWHRLLHIKK